MRLTLVTLSLLMALLIGVSQIVSAAPVPPAAPMVSIGAIPTAAAPTSAADQPQRYPIMPPPWDPPEPITPPITVTSTNVDGLALFIGADVTTVNVTTQTPRCWRVRLADARGQTYDVGAMRGCGPRMYTTFLPFAAHQGA